MNELSEEIIWNATLIYTDGFSEWFEAIHLTKNGVLINRIMNGTIIKCGFIPKKNIKEIKNGPQKILSCNGRVARI